MVCICYGGHRVYFEVFVRTHARSLFDRAPVCEARFSVIEPLVTQMAHVVRIYVADSLRDFGAWYSAVQVQHLRTNLLHYVCCRLDGHQFVVEGVACSHHFYVVQVVRVYGRQRHSAVVHLASEDFVSEKPVTEYSTVAVRTVQALLSCYIRQITNHCVHTVVLLLNVIQVLAVSVDRVVSEYSLEQQERVEILVVPAGCVVEHSDA